MKLVSALSSIMLLALVACSVDGTPGPAGENGPPGSKGKDGENNLPDEGVSLVTPSKGILDREVEVSIGGSGTRFDEGAQPDFGPGIEVLEVITSSPTLITARLRIAKDAEVGKRKVTIGSLVADGAFTVIPAIEVIGKAVPQGGLAEMGIENNDAKAFDGNAFRLEAPGVIDLGTQVMGPTAASAFFLVAPLAPAGKKQLAVSNLGPDGKPRISFLSAPDALEIAPRSPSTFVPDMVNTETFAGGYETKLYRLPTPASMTAIVDYRIQVDADSPALPVGFVFGGKGDAESALATVMPSRNPFTGEYAPPPYDLHVGLPIAASADPNDQFVVIADLSNQPNATVKVSASRVAATMTPETPAPHDASAPQSLDALPPVDGKIVSGTLGNAAEIDVYKWTVAAADKVQIVASSEADLEIILTKDPNVFEDPPGTPAAERKVLGYMYPGKKFAAQRALPAIGGTELYAVVLSDVQGSVKTGKYMLGARKLP